MQETIYISQMDKMISRTDIMETLKFYENDIIFLGGSLIESSINSLSNGMGNKYSDIDIFILAEDVNRFGSEEVEYNQKYVKTQFKRLHGINLDIEIYSLSAVTEAMEQLNQCNFDPNTRLLNLLKLPDGFDFDHFTSLIHRFLNSVPIYNEASYHALYSSLRKENYYRIMCRLAVNIVDNSYEDAVGNLENNQNDVAVHISRSILLQTVKAYLFNKNASLDRDKWIPLKLRNLANTDEEANRIYRTFVQLYYEVSLPDDNALRENAERILGFSEEVIQKIGQEGRLF